MSEISFRLAKHSAKPVQIVEILLQGAVVGVIYPATEGIKIVSAHMEKIFSNDGVGQFPPIPSMEIVFNPRPYRIEGGRLVKEDIH